MISLTDLYAISYLEGVGEQTLRKVIKSGLTISDLFIQDSASLKKIFHTQKFGESFRDAFYYCQEKAIKELESLNDQSISVIHYFNDYYPAQLKLLEDFPIFLFCKGNLSLLQKQQNVAVIGTRENSDVGAKIARSTGLHFATKGYTIVSGLAKGIDAIGHLAALEANGATIAVLIDVSKIYPKENYELARRILNNGGLLIAENKPGSFQGKNSFVLRDRIQSGLSLAIFPIETDITGGTMHTVKYAQKQNRLIFVPNVFHPSIKAWYDNSIGSGFDKIRGISHLITTKQAQPYTKEDYLDLERQLKEKSNALGVGINYEIAENPSNPDLSVKVNENFPQGSFILNSRIMKEESVEDQDTNINDETSNIQKQISEYASAIDKLFDRAINIDTKIKSLNIELKDLSAEVVSILKQKKQLESSVKKLDKPKREPKLKKTANKKSKREEQSLLFTESETSSSKNQ